MGKLLRRRNMIIQAKASPSGALYQLRQGQIPRANNCTIDINGNHIAIEQGTISASTYISGTAWGSTALTDPWFTIPAGSVVKFKVKNVTYINDRTSGAVRVNDSVCFADGTSAWNIALSLKKAETTVEDAEVTSSVLESDKIVACIRQQIQNNVRLNYDVELWVDDVRYL